MKGRPRTRLTLEEFKKRAREEHGSRYDYSRIEKVTNNRSRVEIVCGIHGVFEQQIKVHLRGFGCKKCNNARTGKPINGPEEIEAKARAIHGNRYEYDTATYRKSTIPFRVICPDHGEWWVTLVNHVTNGSRCPSCAGHTSLAENEIRDFLLSQGEKVDQRNRDLIKPLELDLVIHEKKLAIEYCGLFFHSEKGGGKSRGYHRNKRDQCKRIGYRLITIFEDEWLDKRGIVESRLKHILGRGTRGVGARRLNIREIDSKMARGFYNLYHIQGGTTRLTWNLGAFWGDDLVGVMSFSPPRIALGRKSGGPELIRFSTDGRSYPGLADRLLRAFIRQKNPDQIVSYADMRWSEGDVYEKLGFRMERASPPSYWYLEGKKRLHRYGYRKGILLKKYPEFNSSMTEREIMLKLNYDRIWDCGALTYVWSAPVL